MTPLTLMPPPTLDTLVALSKRAGERLDLVQAGGGNTSVKLDDQTMHVKASGVALGELTTTHGHVAVTWPAVQNYLARPDLPTTLATDKRATDADAAQAVAACQTSGTGRPSIETFLHALLPHRLVLHTHPMHVNVLLSQPTWQEAAAALADRLGVPFICVPYHTPGLALALAMRAALPPTVDRDAPLAVFLQNHGMIVAGPTLDAVWTTHEALTTAAAHQLGADDEAAWFQRVSELGSAYRQVTQQPTMIAAPCEDARLLALLAASPDVFTAPPFCPDTLVYAGVGTAVAPTPNDVSHALTAFHAAHGVWPRVLLVGPYAPPEARLLVVFAASVRKTREVEEMLWFHGRVHQLAASTGTPPSPLPDDELAYLNHWEAEKYRQKL